METDFIVEGFQFATKKDAELAEQERKKIEYLEAHIDYNNPESILKIYTKAIQDRVFKTPVGTMYLKQLQDFLKQKEEVNQEEVTAIPLYITYDGEIRSHTSPAKQRIQPSTQKEKKNNLLSAAIAVNVALVIAIIAMFYITLKADQPNILNYEQNLVNKYAAWEQELTEREQALREQELQMKKEN